MIDTYRKLVYENSIGEKVDISLPFNSFIYDLQGMGFSYENDIQENNYTDRLTVASNRLINQSIKGKLIITDLLQRNSSIYDLQENIARILNYDQLVRKVSRKDVSGKLYYTNASGRQVYTPCIIRNFSFGEISEQEEIWKELEVGIEFDRLSKTWIGVTPKTIIIFLQGSDEAHYHPYNHPYTHGETYQAGNGAIANIEGTDLAKIIMKVNGEVTPFTLTIEDLYSKDIKEIKYDSTIFEGETLIINNFEYSCLKNGIKAINDFDLYGADSPFFDLLPNTDYKISVDSANLRGSIEIEIYESWVSVP